MRLLKIYLPWIGLPLALFVAGIPFLLNGGSARGELPREALTGKDRGRSALKFHALTKGGFDETPVHTVNRQGLSIDISVDPHKYEHMIIPILRFSYNRRDTDVAVSFGGLKPTPGLLRTRGGTSLLKGDRINFSIRLMRPVMITPEIEMDRFYLMNMKADPLHYKLEFAYSLLADLGLFPPLHQFAKVLVNGEPQGMFLLVERPRDAIRRVNRGTVSVSRRGRMGLFLRKWSKSVPFAGQNIKELVSVLREGAENNIVALEKVIDLEAYLTWMAINSLLKNADTRDEVFLFEVRKDRNQPEPLRIMAWDYDEILMDPEEPIAYTDPLLYTGNPTSLDVLIKRDLDLYERYKACLRRLLTSDLRIESLVERLNGVHALRDRLDDGLPRQVQDENRRLRKSIVDKFEKNLRERHATLLDRLKVND